nr:immunoglobulin heavy chain junction region [Macaca mulatta]MOW77610.1 immunoglobulin heavy chain junction region [Macaca mulatta]MOW81952.1 immunoglobulin heavy chain junction region [Macaca mulatta]
CASRHYGDGLRNW